MACEIYPKDGGKAGHDGRTLRSDVRPEIGALVVRSVAGAKHSSIELALHIEGAILCAQP